MVSLAACAKSWASRPWKLSYCVRKWGGVRPTTLDGTGGRDDEPGHLALHWQAVGLGACLSCGGHRTLHRLLAAARARRLAPAGGLLALVRMPNWETTSGASWRRRPSQAKGPARGGHGCGIAVSAPRRVGSCA